MEIDGANPKVGNFQHNGPEMMRAAERWLTMESFRCSSVTLSARSRSLEEQIAIER